jgi:thiamine biosynthesis lipoprotein
VDAHVLGAGGDVRVRGALKGAGWHMGVTDPHRPGRLLAAAELTGGAVATSGLAERGFHI